MNERSFAGRVKQALDAGLEVRPEVAARLKVAREQALERRRAPARQWVLAGAAGAGTPLGASPRLLVSALAAAAILVAAAIGLQSWQESQLAARAAAEQAAEIEEVDTGVLIGELPIKAYLDEGFHAWLKHTSQ